MRQLTLGKVGKKISVKKDHWILDQDLELLNSRSTKRRQLTSNHRADSVEWKDLRKDSFMQPETMCIRGTIVQIKRTVKAKWIKLYLRRGEDIGVCLIPNSEDNHAFKIGMAVTATFDRVIGLEFDKTISSFLCTRSIGVLCLGELVIVEQDDPTSKILAELPSLPSIMNNLLEIYQLSRSTNSNHYRIKMEVRYVEARYKGKKVSQAIKLRDAAGSMATLLLYDEQTDIYDVAEGDFIVLTGSTVVFKEARFLIFLGPNSCVELEKSSCSYDHAVVPDIAVRIESIIDKIVRLDDDCEECFSFEALLTQFNPENSVFAECSDCRSWQRVTGPCCRTCKSCSGFSRHRFDVSISLCDESGQWSNLYLPDRIIRSTMGMLPSDKDLKQKSTGWLLTWVNVTGSARKHYEKIHCSIIAIAKSPHNTT